MRRGVGMFLVFVGAFLLVTAILAQAYAAPRLLRTPLDVDTVTDLAGTAELGGPDGVETFPVKVYSTTKADSEMSDDDVVVFRSSSCVVRDEDEVDGCVSNDDPQERLLTASVDEFATDRFSGEAINDAKYLSSSAEPHTGLVNKWPFKAEKTNYPYWSGTAGESVEAVYQGTDEIEGLEVYLYEVTIQDAPIDVADGVPGLYNDTINISVEPLTGAILNQSSSQTRTTTAGDLVLGLDAAFTDEQVKTSAADAESNVSGLVLITKTVPIIGYVGGLLFLAVGLLLVQRGQDKPKTRTRSRRERVDAA